MRSPASLFTFSCSNIFTSVVIHCLTHLFAIYSRPACIHSDHGTSFMSDELRTILHGKVIAVSHTTAYNPSTMERWSLNGTIRRAVTWALNSQGLEIQQWKTGLFDALHSIRSLLCTATNATYHEGLLLYMRRACTGTSLPSWLMDSNRALLKNQNRHSRYDSLPEGVELLDCNSTYARGLLPDRSRRLCLKKLGSRYSR